MPRSKPPRYHVSPSANRDIVVVYSGRHRQKSGLVCASVAEYHQELERVPRIGTLARASCRRSVHGLALSACGAGFDDSGFVCEDDGLCSVAEVEFGEEPGDMCLDGRFAQE